MSADLAIRIEGLVKRFGDVVAVDGLDLDVARGECFGLLGPNGAGKTTTVEILEGLTPMDGGTVELLGRTWAKDPDELRARLGVALQETRLYDRLSVEETLRLFQSFYQGGKTLEVDALLDEMQLAEKRATYVMKLSGGQRQRLAVALGLIGDPEVLFLDEPTTGLDPQSRRALWDTIAALRARGRTVVLTTHYMDEAERLCDRVAIIDRGRRIALGTPAELIDKIGGHHLVEVSTDRPLPPEALAGLRGVRAARAQTDDGQHDQHTNDGYLLSIDEPHLALPALIARLAERGVQPTRLVSRTATLDDVFLSLTGRNLRED